MDVMKPELIWIEGRCYRFFDSTAWSAKDHASTPYVEDSNPQEFEELNEETCTVDIKTECLPNGNYRHRLYIPPRLLGFLIGAKGATIKQLTADTKTVIRLPPKNMDGDVDITGPTPKSVASARHRIDLLLESSKKKIGGTHFISIPLNNQVISSNFEKFRSDVLNKIANDSRGVQENLFQRSAKLHLTIAVFILVYNQEIDAVIEALKECKETIINPFINESGVISLKVQGVDCMNDDPSNVDVLFAHVHSDNNILQELVNEISKYFSDKRLSKEARENATNVKMHVTLMNSKYLVSRSSESRNWKQRQSFDATKIIQTCKDYYFGESELTKLDFCLTHTTGENGYYEVLTSLNLLD